MESNIKTDMDGNITCETCGEQIEPTSMLLRTGVQVYWFCENCETEYFVDLWFRSKPKQVRHPLKEANRCQTMQ
jgi:ribosomal protein L24E